MPNWDQNVINSLVENSAIPERYRYLITAILQAVRESGDLEAVPEKVRERLDGLGAAAGSKTWDREDARDIRSLVIHEGNVIDHRIRWLVMLQAFFLACCVFGGERLSGLTWAVALINMFSAASALVAIWIAHQTITKLLQLWEDRHTIGYDGPDVIGRRLGGVWVAMCPWFVVPVLLILLWIGVLFWTNASGSVPPGGVNTTAIKIEEDGETNKATISFEGDVRKIRDLERRIESIPIRRSTE
jgi:hypothetical protein